MRIVSIIFNSVRNKPYLVLVIAALICFFLTDLPCKSESSDEQGSINSADAKTNHSAKSIALAIACVQGTGLLGKPLYIEYSCEKNNDIVTFYDLEEYDTQKDKSSISNVKVTIENGMDQIHTEKINIKNAPLNEDGLVFEKALLVGMVWMAKLDAKINRCKIRTSRTENGAYHIGVDTMQTTFGGDFGIIVSKDFKIVLLWRGS